MQNPNPNYPNPNPNPNPFQPFSTYRANNHGIPLFRSIMANPTGTFVYHPSPKITVISVPADVTVIIQRRANNQLHFMPTRVPSGTLPSNTFGQASLPLQGLRSSRLFGHRYNDEAPRTSNLHAHIDLNNFPPCNTNFQDQEKSVARIYKCDLCLVEFSSPQAYGGHMSCHSTKKIKTSTHEIGESSRPWKRVKENPVMSGASTSVVDISSYASKLQEIKRETSQLE